MALQTHIPAPRNTIETYCARPAREPPRNENGVIICMHHECRDNHEIFRRPCEWNKHMDKHERPYKCNEPTCEEQPGFTYSGGLLRHMREVHKMGAGPSRRPLYCPHANCIRSIGEGFTRRENLAEHLRRRHSCKGHCSSPPKPYLTLSDPQMHPQTPPLPTDFSEGVKEGSHYGGQSDTETVQPRYGMLADKFRPIAAVFVEPYIISKPEVSSSEETHVIVYDDFWCNGLLDTDLHTRAWVLLERLLGPRTINSGKEQMFWEWCQHKTSYPKGVADGFINRRTRAWRLGGPLRHESNSLANVHSPLTLQIHGLLTTRAIDQPIRTTQNGVVHGGKTFPPIDASGGKGWSLYPRSEHLDTWQPHYTNALSVSITYQTGRQSREVQHEARCSKLEKCPECLNKAWGWTLTPTHDEHNHPELEDKIMATHATKSRTNRSGDEPIVEEGKHPSSSFNSRTPLSGLGSRWLLVLVVMCRSLLVAALPTDVRQTEDALSDAAAGSFAAHDTAVVHRPGLHQDIIATALSWTLAPFLFVAFVVVGILSEREDSRLARLMPPTIRRNPRDFWTVIAFVSAAALGPFYGQHVFEGPANTVVVACLINQYRACVHQVVAIQNGLLLFVLSWLPAQYILTKLVPEDDKSLRLVVVWLTACMSITAVSKVCVIIQGRRGTISGRVYHNVQVLGANAIVGDYVHVERSLA